MPKTKSTVYFTKITTWKAGKNLKFWERMTPGWSLAKKSSVWVYWKLFVVFYQSSCVILLTWYCQLYFSPWIPHGYPLNGSVKSLFFKVFIILPPVWLLNLGSDLSIDNIVWLGLADTKSGSQNAVKKVLELTEKWKYLNFRVKF